MAAAITLISLGVICLIAWLAYLDFMKPPKSKGESNGTIRKSE